MGRDSFSDTCASIVNGVISVFLLFVVTVLPLIYHNSYFDILETKYRCFYVSVLVMLAVLLVLGLIMLVIDRKEFQGEHAKQLFGKLKPRNWKQTFSAADAAVIAFWLFSVISTLQSEYLYESFWGNEGRYSGLFLMTLYVASYLLISHFWKPNGWVMQAFLAAGMIVCLIGITDYFQMDILHFRGRIKPEQSTTFTSTIGNINTYTAYVALIMGAAAAMFATARGWLQTVWYYACTVIAFIAIVMGCSDNAYLALGALFAFLPLLLFQKKGGVVRYLILVATFASAIQYIDAVNQKYADLVIGLDSLFGVLVDIPKLHVIVIALWILVVAFYLLSRYTKTENKAIGRAMVLLWGCMLFATFAVLVFMFVDANFRDHADHYGLIRKYLVFDDYWGTRRGYIWRKSAELYKNLPVMHKLFGYGPDTFGIMTTKEFLEEMVEKTTWIFDSAHNEYLQYLLTIGFCGLAAYLIFLGTICWKMSRSWKIYKGKTVVYAFGCMFAVLCYLCQAIVNINLPIVTPVLWMLLGIGSSCANRRWLSVSE